MFLSILFKIIAVLFLILFFIRLFSPKIFPFFIKGLSFVYHFFGKFISFIFQSSLYTISLLLRRTVYVIGIDLIVAIIYDIFMTLFVYQDTTNWFSTFRHHLFNAYVLSFFITTYLLGIYHYLKDKKNKKFNLFSFFGHQFQNKIYKKKKYYYDETKNKYTYRD